MYYNQNPTSSLPRWLRERAGRWCFVCLVLIIEVDGSTYCLDLSLPPAGVSLLPDEDHLAPLKCQLLLAGGRVGCHHSRKFRLLGRFGVALEVSTIMIGLLLVKIEYQRPGPHPIKINFYVKLRV